MLKKVKGNIGINENMRIDHNVLDKAQIDIRLQS